MQKDYGEGSPFWKKNADALESRQYQTTGFKRYENSGWKRSEYGSAGWKREAYGTAGWKKELPESS